MKVAVINFSGNVGKTTMARHLLAPRIPGARLISVESINTDYAEEESIKGRQFKELQVYLQTAADVIVDIGASNVEELLGLMRKYSGSQHDFDYFVVPAVPGVKQQLNTVGTLSELARMRVPPEKLRVVFNQVEGDGTEADVRQAFAALFTFVGEHPECGELNPAARLTTNELYQLLVGSDRSVIDVAHDETDFKRLIALADDRAEKIKLAEALALRRLAQGVLPELEACFAALKLA
ncbi:StbB family protein [Ideonella sp.]|uniref:StbB family protein n=1 Tax=Ideonella sp. TaxID=1929293 RepID=UPI002B4A35C7|nr:StbB family protein [Ideonella sp.]HJV71224.1 StbB family protein [Ideonella sp.]